MTNRIYAYTVVGKDSAPWRRGDVTGTGLVKVGQTTKASARARIKEQLGTAYPDLRGVTILLDDEAVRVDGTEFSDHDVHATLVASGVRRVGGEWFEATLDEIRAAIVAVRHRVVLESLRTDDFAMRPEQVEAVERTAAYFTQHTASGAPVAPRFLWNAKMRFGKTFTTYQLAKRMGWTRILVLTYKPAVKTAWRDDLVSHVDFTGWSFVDRDTEAIEAAVAAASDAPLVWFASLQDLGGRTKNGAVKAHNEAIHDIEWDCVVLDEYHFGAWRDTARSMYEGSRDAAAELPDDADDERVAPDDVSVRSGHYLYLSGTPFRAVTNGEFTEDAVFNWTYIDEQHAKEVWDPYTGANPYEALPRMEMFTYRLGDGAQSYADDGEHNGFSLNAYFKATKTDDGHVFEDRDRVLAFLDMLRGKLSEQMRAQIVGNLKAPFPYGSADFLTATRHSVWYMNDVAACFAMADLLAQHPFFSGYRVTVAAGDKAGQGALAKPPVEAAIDEADRAEQPGSITLSCGKLMTGVTVPQWSSIFMLRSLDSPESYFQAAFRVQSPWTHKTETGQREILKRTAYVFEFDPNRALSLVSEYAAKLATSTDVTTKQALGQLMNYLPIYAFDGGSMSRLDVDEVMDWATTGIGASALARRWNSPLLVDVNEHTLGAVLAQSELVERLSQIEDFRALVQHGPQVVTSTKALKKAKREKGASLTPEEKAAKKKRDDRRKEIREKLQKFLAKVPVFMYSTDHREEALRDVIESLDSALFERVTGLTVEDFQQLSALGLFNTEHIDAAIYQFRAFEVPSLGYAELDPKTSGSGAVQVGLLDRSVVAPRGLAVDEFPEECWV